MLEDALETVISHFGLRRTSPTSSQTPMAPFKAEGMQCASTRSLFRVVTAPLKRNRWRPVRSIVTLDKPLDATRFRGTAAEGLVNLNLGKPIHPPKYSRKNKTFVDLEVKASTLGPSAGVGVFARQKIGRNTLLTEYGVDVVETSDPRTKQNSDYHMDHVEDHLTILGEPWKGQVPSGLVPYTTPLGHLVNDPACIHHTLLCDHWKAFKGMWTLMEHITQEYEVPSIAGANVTKGFDVDEGRMMLVSTKDIEQGEELFLYYGWNYWMERATKDAIILDTMERTMGHGDNDQTLGAWGRANVCSWFVMRGQVPPHVVFLDPTSQELLVMEDMKPRRASEEECRSYQQIVLGLDPDDRRWPQGLGQRDKLVMLLARVTKA